VAALVFLGAFAAVPGEGYALAERIRQTPSSTPTPNTPSVTPVARSEADVAALVSPSVVQVVSATGEASGVKIAQGVLTNEHVVAEENGLEVVRSDGTRRPANVIRSDPLYDLALLATDLEVPLLEPEGARQNRQGDSVLVVGYPLARLLTGPPSVSRGLLSAVREVEGVVFVQTDAAMDFGSSGSAIVNVRGKLLGIAAGGLGESGGVNLGIATESIQDFLNGVSLVGPDFAEPDDMIDQARPLELDAPPEIRSLHVPGDVDWVSLSLTDDDSIALFTDSVSCDTSLQLHGPDRALVAEDDRRRFGGSHIEFTALGTGTYYARISHRDPTGLCRSYELAARRILDSTGALTDLPAGR